MKEAHINKDGLRGDREFVILSDKGKFLTARQYPKIVLVKATFWRRALTLSADNGSSVVAHLPDAKQKMQSFKVWADTVTGADMGDEIASWLSDYLGIGCRLIAATANTVRQGKYRGTPNGYADASPILLTSEASHKELNNRLDKPIPIGQLRPNIVVGGDMAAFDEDLWAEITIADLPMQVAWGCSRCIFTTVDPKTGVKSDDMEPVHTLKSFRTGPDKQFHFGQNILPQTNGIIRVGDTVEVVTRRDRPLYAADWLV